MYVLAVVVCLPRLTRGPDKVFFLELAVRVRLGAFGYVGRHPRLAGAIPAHLWGREAQGRSSRFLAANPFAEVRECGHGPDSCICCK